MSAGLRFAGAGRRFGPVVALAGLELECPPGALTCLAGPNGAGKSTALGLAAGLLEPSGGAVWFAGERVTTRAAAASTGYLPQRSAFHPALRLGEVVDFTLAARGWRRPPPDEALEVTGLEPMRRRFVGHLSGGWVRRLGLFAALAGSPDLLLLDEPFAGLDPATHDRLVEHLRRRLASGATVVVASHDFEVVDGFAPRLAVLDEGRLRLLADPPAEDGRTRPAAPSRSVYLRALAAPAEASAGAGTP